MRNDGRVDAEVGEVLPPVLAVHDHAVEAGEEISPEPWLPRGAPRQEIVCREHGRHTRPQQHSVELGRSQPLQVKDVRSAKQERRASST